MSDLISREALCEYALNQKDKSITPNDIMRFPSAQPKKRTEERTETHTCDYINRKDAIDAHYEYCNKHPDAGFPVWSLKILEDLPSAQPERLTDDDFETIRIHLNAYKEKLCNQQRWKEADEYQRILDRFISFASAQPVAKDINVPVKDCISRQAAVEAIMDADVCVTWNGVISDDDAVDIAIKSTKGSVISSIVNMPSAQPEVLACGEGELIAQPKIIRCKECVYADENYHCDYMTTWNDGDCFCCYGKRRNDEQ